ncbi:MAG: type VI secretion protein [Rhodomicrobium sp.]|nr:type VI secretion protein [Rhodomicrobium sp.]
MTELSRTPVFRALTEPQRFAGVTYSYFVINLVVTTEAFLITRSFFALFIAAALHAVGYVASIREPRIFDLWVARVSKCPRVPNYGFWRCNSYQP